MSMLYKKLKNQHEEIRMPMSRGPASHLIPVVFREGGLQGAQCPSNRLQCPSRHAALHLTPLILREPLLNGFWWGHQKNALQEVRKRMSGGACNTSHSCGHQVALVE